VTAPYAGPPGDLEAFCQRMYPVLVRTLTIHTGSRPLAEDLAQETLARVWQKWSQVSGYESPDRFALRCAFNLASSGFRRRAAERRAQTRSGLDPTEVAPVDSATELAVRQAVVSLPPQQRSAIACRYFLGLSVLETADAVGIAEGTVKSLTHKATTRLRSLLVDSPDIVIPALPIAPPEARHYA
jgi:RNA polymerase sigma factor (sigma-70 family)